MNVKSIILIIVIIVLLIILFRYIAKSGNTLSSLTDAKTMITIKSSDMDNSNTTASTSNFCYSIWFYIDDWNYRYGEPKVIFGRMSGFQEPCPSVVLGATQNNLIISQEVYPGTDVAPIDDSSSSAVVHTCNVANVPLQKWVNLIVSAYGRSMDIYIDGKLVRTCVLPGVSKVDPDANVFVTPMGGFSGYTSTFQYWGDSCDPQKAWNIYKKGYGGSWLGFLGKYTIKVSLMEGDTEDGSIEV
jgi:hypothetical protein